MRLLAYLHLIILLILAATSHDFWLSYLTPPIWKRLHMGIYIAYFAIVLHIVLGAMQAEKGLYSIFVGTALAAVPVMCIAFLSSAQRKIERSCGNFINNR